MIDEKRIAVRKLSGKHCVFKEGEGHTGTAESYSGIASVNWRLGELETAPLLTGKIYIEFGNVYYMKGDGEIAIRYYNKSLSIFDVKKDFYQVWRVYNNLAEVYYSLERFEDALELSEKCIKLAKLVRFMDCDMMLRRGSILGKGSENKSEKYFETCLRIYDEIKVPFYSAIAYYQYGLLLKDKGEKGRAEEFLRRLMLWMS